MKKSEEPAGPADPLELEFPDWSGMDDSSDRLTPEAAFRLCEHYPLLYRKSRQHAADENEKCIVEFVL